MKNSFVLIVLIIVMSCNNLNRDKQVDKSKLTGDDYRLFQNTPAWALAKAVEDENELIIKEILKENLALIDFQEPKYGNTLLMLTILNQQLESFNILLANGANVNLHNNYDGSSAIIKASSSKYYDIKFLKRLVFNGADVNDVEKGERQEGNTTRMTPLMEASQIGRIDMVRFLVDNGADINYQNEFNQSALSKSIIQKNYEISIYLLQNGADYERPIFYRPDYSIPIEEQDPNDKGKPMYLVDVLRETFLDFDTKEYKYKMKIVDFLKSKGIDYRATPIPEYIKKKAREEYPNNWKEYLEEY